MFASVVKLDGNPACLDVLPDIVPGVKDAAVFYGRYFGWYGWGDLVLPALLTLVPSLVFALGSGWLFGRIRPWLIYVWMLFPFACAAFPLPKAMGLWNGSFFTGYPLTLGTLDPSFAIPVSVLLIQCLLLAGGAALLVLRLRKR